MAAKRLYNWAKWFKKPRFILSRGPLDRGHDYECSQLTMAQQIRNAATTYARGQEVHVEEGPGGKSLIVIIRPRE